MMRVYGFDTWGIDRLEDVPQAVPTQKSPPKTGDLPSTGAWQMWQGLGLAGKTNGPACDATPEDILNAVKRLSPYFEEDHPEIVDDMSRLADLVMYAIGEGAHIIRAI